MSLFPMPNANANVQMAAVVKLDVGGVKFKTSVQTLRKYPDSMLGRMFDSDVPPKVDQDGYVFLDANGDMFTHILQFLRVNALDLPDGFKDIKALESTIEYFQLKELLALVQEWKVDKASTSSRPKLLQVVVSFQNVGPHNSLKQWLYIKHMNEAHFSPVTVDDINRKSHEVEYPHENLFDCNSHIAKLVFEEKLTTVSGFHAALLLLDVRRSDRFMKYDRDYFKGAELRVYETKGN